METILNSEKKVDKINLIGDTSLGIEEAREQIAIYKENIGKFYLFNGEDIESAIFNLLDCEAAKAANDFSKLNKAKIFGLDKESACFNSGVSITYYCTPDGMVNIETNCTGDFFVQLTIRKGELDYCSLIPGATMLKMKYEKETAVTK